MVDVNLDLLDDFEDLLFDFAIERRYDLGDVEQSALWIDMRLTLEKFLKTKGSDVGEVPVGLKDLPKIIEMASDFFGIVGPEVTKSDLETLAFDLVDDIIYHGGK